MDLDKKDKSIYEKKIWVYSFSIVKNRILMQNGRTVLCV